jgi:arylsulfatase A-like enzyme
MRTRNSRAAVAVLFLLTACFSGAAEPPPPPPPVLTPPPRMVPVADRRPNILIFLSDDQRASTLPSMPKMLEIFAEGGTRFGNAYATTPVCCPSRASVMTGMYAHNHGVLTNGEAEEFDQDPTLQRYLKEHGYYTGMAGKFLNLWDVRASPSYFDRWALMEDDYEHAYYDFTANVNGNLETIDEYSTTWIGDVAQEWLGEFEANDDKPWYLYLAPYAPHQPATPEPQYEEARVSLYRGSPGVAERDRTDKSLYVQDKTIELRLARQIRRHQIRSLYSLDDMVDEVYSTLDALDEGRDTLAIFMSDNGHMWGEHHLSSKRWPYTESIRIPMLLRWPGHLKKGAYDRRLVANVDVLPTILDALGVWPNRAYKADGRSMLDRKERDHLLLENWFHQRGAPDWAATLTHEWEFIEYYDEDGTLAYQEYYDMKEDPYQLENLLADRDRFNDPNTEELSRKLAKDRKCKLGRCP